MHHSPGTITPLTPSLVRPVLRFTDTLVACLYCIDELAYLLFEFQKLCWNMCIITISDTYRCGGWNGCCNWNETTTPFVTEFLKFVKLYLWDVSEWLTKTCNQFSHYGNYIILILAKMHTKHYAEFPTGSPLSLMLVQMGYEKFTLQLVSCNISEMIHKTHMQFWTMEY